MLQEDRKRFQSGFIRTERQIPKRADVIIIIFIHGGLPRRDIHAVRKKDPDKFRERFSHPVRILGIAEVDCL